MRPILDYFGRDPTKAAEPPFSWLWQADLWAPFLLCIYVLVSTDSNGEIPGFNELPSRFVVVGYCAQGFITNRVLAWRVPERKWFAIRLMIVNGFFATLFLALYAHT